MATRWFTSYDSETTEWRHKIVDKDLDIDFSVFVKSSTIDEFREFVKQYLPNIDKEVLHRLDEQFYVTNTLISERENSPSHLAKFLPGVDEVVIHPVTKEKDTVFNIVINLNDCYKWPREDVADWLDSLDADLEFKTEVEKKKTIEINSK